MPRRNADEDRKRKEQVEARNRADSLVYETEKNLKSTARKLGRRAQVGHRVEDRRTVKDALKGEDAGALTGRQRGAAAGLAQTARANSST